MIEFSDRTLRQSDEFDKVSELMVGEGSDKIGWMLRSEVLVDTNSVMARYLIHFWSDGRAVIMETDHPPIMDVPEDDIIALRDWSESKGWKLCLHKDLLDDPTAFNFWLRLFRAGVVHSEVLDTHEKEEIERFQKAFDKLQEEED